jgi:hypothetical protein
MTSYTPRTDEAGEDGPLPALMMSSAGNPTRAPRDGQPEPDHDRRRHEDSVPANHEGTELERDRDRVSS